MLCPEGETVTKENVPKEDTCPKKSRKVPVEGTGSLEINLKNPKTWKKSITNFFRHQLRSTKSNDGDHSSGSTEKFEDKDIAPELKWQSLGKVFRRQTFTDHWNKVTNQQGECSSGQTKRMPVRKVLSSYFGKSKTPSGTEEN
ncbi:uncharacterized protein LOC106132166 [Amyelois transitella]|uniref:uncharacterized protein LOC106132166 n=1 Tax=Amyelois transitella TaxID=680683 RepID=UPI00067DB3C8|nr:uncharacterized protein LOC106132166 [Amyelois transitella]